jgi:hypothetical protein
MINIFTKFITKNKDQITLGRWQIDYCNKKMNRKIDLSNEDHCGPCGEYMLKKINKINKVDKINL